MPLELELIPPRTRVEANGDGRKLDVSSSQTRTFLCTLEITDQIEQESLDISIWGSADGENWGSKPILKLPQRFYRGETRAVLDLSLLPEVKFIRAKWELNRWGRVAPLPMFVIGLHLTEVAAMPRRMPAERVGAEK
ncbi:MAG: hypothetical protein HY237_01300 [Acidobacteria bacterium]|nr:hypothetical protein [Acidobacteriota bacterium]